MTKEQIEKAARDYALDQLGIVGLPERAEAMKAFMAGARWRVNSVWHDIDKDLPDCGRNVVNEDWFDFEAKSVLDLKRILEKYPFKHWAYVSDLLPEGMRE